jgi:hypothetical protein
VGRRRWRGGIVVDGRNQILDTLAEYAALGLQEAVFKVPRLDDDRFAEFLGTEVLSAARSL